MTHYGLSAEADRAIDEGNSRARGYRPTLAVTKGFRFAVVWSPSGYCPGSLQSKGFVAWMTKYLPKFRFDAERNFWIAPISELGAALDTMNKERLAGCNVSRGADEWLDQLEKAV